MSRDPRRFTGWRLSDRRRMAGPGPGFWSVGGAMTEYLFLMHDDATEAVSDAAWGPYLARPTRRGDAPRRGRPIRRPISTCGGRRSGTE